MEMRQDEQYIEESTGPVEEKQEDKTEDSDINTELIKKVAIGAAAVLIVLLVLVLYFYISSKNNSNTEANAEVSATTLEDGEVDKLNISDPTLASAVDSATVTTEEATTQTSIIDFTIDEESELRKWGYTGDEIALAEQYSMSKDELITTAQAQQEQAQKESLAKVSDTASIEYKTLLATTWLGNAPLDTTSFSSGDPAAVTFETRIANVDYVKCAPTGHQLFLTLNMGNDEKMFMTVTPDRWAQLVDTGNIVIRYEVCKYGEVEVVTTITEVVNQ